MGDYRVYDEATAPEGAQQILENVKKGNGFIPNLYGVMAESPAILEAYLALGKISGKTTLTAVERQVVYQACNVEAECRYCVAAHTMLSQMDKVPQEVTEALRAGTPIADAKLEALSKFTRKMRNSLGWVSEEDTQALLEAGYTKAHIMDVIMLIAHKTMSAYVNRLAQTPVDAAFQPATWEKPVAAE